MKNISIKVHDASKELPCEKYRGENVVTDVLAWAIWDTHEPRPDAEAIVVGFNARKMQWTYAYHYEGKHPYADRIRFWAELPDIKHEDLTPALLKKFMGEK
jgi:hypothetical protein